MNVLKPTFRVISTTLVVITFLCLSYNALCFNLNSKISSTHFENIQVGFQNSISNNFRNNSLDHQIRIRFRDFVLTKSTSIKINDFVYGCDLANLSTIAVSELVKETILIYSTIKHKYYGIGDVLIDSIGSFLIIWGDTLLENTIGNEDIKKYFPPTLNFNLNAHDAYAPCGKYRSDENVYKEMLI